MRAIDLDGSGWRTVVEFVGALKFALRSPDWHGSSINAFVDSMVWGEINDLEPPYLVRVHSLPVDSKEIREYIQDLPDALVWARQEHVKRDGTDVPVAIDLLETSA